MTSESKKWESMNSGYRHEVEETKAGANSWAAPYLAGLAVLVSQVHPGISPDRIVELWQETAIRTQLGPVVNPRGFIEAAKRLKLPYSQVKKGRKDAGGLSVRLIRPSSPGRKSRNQSPARERNQYGGSTFQINSIGGTKS